MKKGLLHREIGKGRRALKYLYTAKMNGKTFKQFIAERITRELLKEYEGPTVSTLINTLAEDPDKLEERSVTSSSALLALFFSSHH